MPFPKGICPKVNVILQLEYELTYYNPESIFLTITPRGHPTVLLNVSGFKCKWVYKEIAVLMLYK